MMKKLLSTLLLLCVAVVGWSATPPGNEGLSITSFTDGNLIVNQGPGRGCEKVDCWQTLIQNAGIDITQTPVTKLTLTGEFSNKSISTVTSADVMKLFLGENNDNTLYLDMSGCNKIECRYTGINEAGDFFTFAPLGGTEQIEQSETYNYKKVEETSNVYVATFDNNGQMVTLTVNYNITNDDIEEGESEAGISCTVSFPWGGEETTTLRYIDGKWYVMIWGANREVTSSTATTTTWYDITDGEPGNVVENIYELGELTQDGDPSTEGNVTTTYYTKTNTWTETVEISSFKFSDAAKTKLNGITFPNSNKFTFIPASLCEGFTALETVVFPNNIVAIERLSFKDCTALENITWSTGLVYIGLDQNNAKDNGIFQGCTSLETINLSACSSLEVIGRAAFEGTTAVTSVTLPTSLKVIGGEAFAGSGFSTISLASNSALEKINFEAFEDCANLTSITFPTGSTLTFIGNDCFQRSGLTSVDMSMCEGITEFQKNGTSNEYKTFWACTSLTEITLPPNLTFVPGSQGLFKDCSNLATVTFTGTAKYENGEFVNPLVIEKEAFSELTNLTTVNFSNNLLRIEQGAFNKCDIINVELQECHELEEIQTAAFKDCVGMLEVHVCSHPKVIRTEAFRNVKSLTRVEIHGCEGTCMTECICENRGFEYDITHNQTAAPSDIMETVALLVFPEDGEVCENSPYTSAWDFFVGDYKNGVMITQENLLCYYRRIPDQGRWETKLIYYELDEHGTEVKREKTIYPECQYQVGNGWHEFIRVGRGEIIPQGEFLRTYSRTAGDGPCMLPPGITAYRAIDYKTDQFAFVLDRQGNYFYDATVVSDNEDDKYKLIDGIDGSQPDDEISAAELAVIGNSKRYSLLTIGGKLFLRPLVAKVAQYTGIEGGYTGDNIAKFDKDEVYDELTSVPGGYSYVPEGTGVVLYSVRVNEESFLMLPGDFGTETVYKKFPHTGDRYEQNRLNSSDKANNINMLQGSYGTGWPVAPVFPWVYNDEDNCEGGHYSKTEPKAYRNFACVMTHKATGTGGLASRNTYGWKRLQPSKLKVNRAFAQIPVSRFDNFNEDADSEQFPGFTIEDTTADVPEVDDEGTETSGNANLMLISIFEDQSEDGAVVDGIEEVKTVDNVVAKKENNAWYTLQGVRVSNLTKGIYIHNGKKVVIK